MGILRNYQYPIPIQAATVYVMELVTGSVEVVVKEAEIETQWLVISSTPEGADVIVNDQLVGNTPFSRKYPEDDYNYRIESPRYHPEAGRVSLKGERKTLNFTLRPRFGDIRVTSAPESGMQIYLNDENTGQTTPATLSEVNSGTHTVKLMNQWYQTQTRRITIADNQTTTVDFSMEPAYADITIVTTPTANIYIDGAEKGRGKISERMMPGVYTFKAALDKHHPVQKQVSVVANDPQTIQLSPQPKLGHIDINSIPFDADIALDGKSYGTTPNTIKNLLEGTYTLSLAKTGYGTVTKTVTIAEGITTDVNETLPSGMEITITSTPTGAQLWIDGVRVGSTPYKATLAFGNHTVKLVNGKREETDQISITQSGKNRWEFDVREFPEIEMVFIKGGRYTMGCTKEQRKDCYDDEKPAHRVTVSDFYMGKYPVTQAQWKVIMGSNPSHFIGCDQCPVENVSWSDTQEFIKKLNYLTGKNYRLPTEAEWEYAARGGTQSKGYKNSGSNTIDDVAWYNGNSGSKTHPVGQKQPNELGFYDMSGNVWEWCSDWYGKDYYKNSPQHNPQGPSSGSLRVLRGGSWDYKAWYCRVSYRYDSPDYRAGFYGFRVVLEL